jgi:glycosyltransferase involved in cell wall biosynthesis
MAKERITFILASRYPSEKAYAVTSGNTALALSALGYEVKLHGVGSAHTDSFGNHVCGHQGLTISALRLVAASDIPVLRALAYYFISMYMALFCHFEEKKHLGERIYWLREPAIAWILSLLECDSRVVLELHHKPGGISSKFVGQLLKKGKTTVVAITSHDYQSFREKFDSHAILLAPMSAPTNFLDKSRSPEDTDFTIVYNGKGISNGHDNNLYILIDALKILTKVENLKMVFIGLETSYRIRINEYSKEIKVSPDKVLYIDHVNHNQIPNFLLKYSVSVVPYPESKYNQSRSPLKIIESAACRIPLVVSQTKAHQVFIDSGYVTPFNDGDAQSLATSIMKIYQGGPEIQTRIDRAFRFAKENTYEFRVRTVLNGM